MRKLLGIRIDVWIFAGVLLFLAGAAYAGFRFLAFMEQGHRAMHAEYLMRALLEKYIEENKRWPTNWDDLRAVVLPGYKRAWAADWPDIEEFIALDFSLTLEQATRQDEDHWTAVRPVDIHLSGFESGFANLLSRYRHANLKPPPVETPRPIILAHYMPWYTAKPFSPVWGWHWTMNAFNPEHQRDGKRQIASHYYPLIGPYDSGDPDVLEYHLLLMKIAGIDGVIVDWYGLSSHLDYPVLHRNAGALLQAANTLGLKFAVCYEDQTIMRLVEAKKLVPSDRAKHAQAEIEWLQKNWFDTPVYVRIDGKPLLLSFGESGLTDLEWEELLRGRGKRLVYLSEHRRRSSAAGAFDWPNPKEYPASLNRFYAVSKDQAVTMPVAFPRFHDIYEEGKAHASWGGIPDEKGRTWITTLERALKCKPPLVQLATWNDWGEGTGIEPTEEFGFSDLETVQRLRRELVDKRFGPAPVDIRLPYQLYQLRRSQRGRPDLKIELDKVAQMIAAGRLAESAIILKRLASTR